jgi:hypothetical protein
MNDKKMPKATQARFGGGHASLAVSRSISNPAVNPTRRIARD